MSSRMSVIYAIVAILLSSLGFLLGMKIKKEPPVQVNECLGEKSSYQAGFDAAVQRLADAKIYNPSSVKFGAANMRGIINDIKDGKMLVSVYPLGSVEKMVPYNRTVVVDDQTKIFRQTNKDKIIYQQEVVEYQTKVLENLKASSENKTTLVHPSAYDRTPATKSDLQVGMNIGIVFEGDDGGDAVASEIYIGTNTALVNSQDVGTSTAR